MFSYILCLLLLYKGIRYDIWYYIIGSALFAIAGEIHTVFTGSDDDEDDD